jgi:hypothetical protein
MVTTTQLGGVFDVHVAVLCVRPTGKTRPAVPKVDATLRRSLVESRERLMASSDALREAESELERADAEALRRRRKRGAHYSFLRHTHALCCTRPCVKYLWMLCLTGARLPSLACQGRVISPSHSTRITASNSWRARPQHLFT